MTSPTEGGPGGHPPRHSHVPPSPPKARAKQFSLLCPSRSHVLQVELSPPLFVRVLCGFL